MIYTKHVLDKEIKRRYKEISMPVIVKESQTYALHLSGGLKESDRQRYLTQIVPAHFSSLHSISDQQCLEGNSTLQTAREGNSRKQNLLSSQNAVLRSSSNLKQRYIMRVWVFQNIE